MRINLKCLRIKHKLTQDGMAEKLSCSRQNYISIENGAANGSIKFWLNVQSTFNVSDDEMWGLIKCE